MFRVQKKGMPGWSTLQKSSDSDIFNDNVTTYIENLKALGIMRDSCQHSMWNADEVVRFNFVFNDNRVVAGLKMDISIYEWHVWRARTDACWLLEDATENNMSYFKQVGVGPYLASRNISEIYDIKKMVRSNKVKVNCTNEDYIGKLKVIIISIFMGDEIESFNFSSSIDVNKIRQYSDVLCVNACYTGTIGGVMKKSNIVPLFQCTQSRGPCGSEMVLKSISLGVVQIFRSNNGVRRVTCKAFSSINDANLMTDLMCVQFHMFKIDLLVPHMIVAYGYTGKQIDIAVDGYIKEVILQHFGDDVVFNAIIEEVNIHIIFSWKNLFSVYNKLITTHHKNKKIENLKVYILKYADISTSLQHVSLCLSVTCRGTCIYRIGIKSKKKNFIRQVLNERFEILVMKICSYVHIILSL
jgi:hypothetical protein